MNDLLNTWMESHGLLEQSIRSVDDVFMDEKDPIISFRIYLNDGSVVWKHYDVSTRRRWCDTRGFKWVNARPMILSSLPECDTLVVCEGESDWLLAFQLTGYDCLCIPGSTNLPETWSQALHRYESVVAIPDADEPGKMMLNRLAELCPTAKYVKLADGEDLCSSRLDSSSLLELITRATQVPAPVKKTVKRNNYEYRGNGEAHKPKLIRLVAKDTHLFRKGGELVGLCPFHDEKTPSFMVNEKKNMYYCHGCGRGGDAVSYLMAKGMSFPMAMRTLEEMR